MTDPIEEPLPPEPGLTDLVSAVLLLEAVPLDVAETTGGENDDPQGRGGRICRICGAVVVTWGPYAERHEQFHDQLKAIRRTDMEQVRTAVQNIRERMDAVEAAVQQLNQARLSLAQQLNQLKARVDALEAG